MVVIGNYSDWLMECGVNVSVTLCVLYALTGNRPVQAPRKAIILRRTWAKGAYTHLPSHARVRAHSACAEWSPSCSVVTTLIGLCNCLAKHCGKQPVQICPFASNRFLNMDSHRHDSAIQEIVEPVCICVSERLCVCVCVIMIAYMCVSVCVCVCISMAPLREVSVVASHSTACRLWFSCGPPPGPTFGTQRKYTRGTCSHCFLDPSFIGLCVFCVHLVCV